MRIYIILYIVMKSTLRNSVKEVYKKSNSNNNNNYGFNNSLINNNNQNTSNNISINNKNNSNKKNTLNQNNNNYDEIKTKPIFNMNSILIMIFFVIFVSIIGLVIYFKDKVLDFIKNLFFKEESEKAQNEINALRSELEENQKNQLMIEEELERLREENDKKIKNNKEKKTENNEEPETKTDTDKSNKKIKAKTNEELRKLYSDNKFVKQDSYCYIGSDNNMRQCVEVYNGDICESGDVYNRIDECLMPKHFKN